MRAIINTPAYNLNATKAFYEKLHYRIITLKGIDYATDGQYIIRLDNRKIGRAGLVLFADLQNFSLLNFEKVQGILTGIDPNGIYVYMEDISVYPTFSDKKSEVLTGNFMGISIETLKFEGTIRYWEQFGYTTKMGSLEQGWVQMKNESHIGIGIMKYGSCPHSFRNPSLTFFNGGNNLNVIKKIRNASLPISEEISHFNPDGLVDNIVLVDPGGYGFFIFSD